MPRHLCFFKESTFFYFLLMHEDWSSYFMTLGGERTIYIPQSSGLQGQSSTCATTPLGELQGCTIWEVSLLMLSINLLAENIVRQAIEYTTI